MAKIYNPQDQNGIGLINQTIFSQRTDDIQRKLEIITGYEFTEDIEDVGNLDSRITAEAIRASQAESRIESELNDAINAEKARAEAREDAMEASFNDEINNVTLTINNRISELHGTISTVSTIINDEIERSTNQDTRLNSEIETLSEEIEILTEKDKEIDIEIGTSKLRVSNLETMTNILSNVETYSNEDTAAKDNANTYGFLITSPKSGYLTKIVSHCRTTTTGSARGGETYLKIWSENNEFIACSDNYHSHEIGSIHEYNFKPVKLETGKKYKISFVPINLRESENINDKTEVCLSTTGRYSDTDIDPIFGGYTLDGNFNTQYFSGKIIQAICALSIADEFGALTKNVKNLSEEVEKNKKDISALGLDIDAINANINLISNPSIDILLIPNNGEAELINEINLNVYTIDDSGNTIQVDTLPDIKISYQSNDAFIYTSNAVAYSPYINISGLDGNLNIETGENNITEVRAQHDAILQFSGLLGIKEDITRIVIIDAIVAEGPENGYANCKHISRILPIKFHVAPNVTEEN